MQFGKIIMQSRSLLLTVVLASCGLAVCTALFSCRNNNQRVDDSLDTLITRTTVPDKPSTKTKDTVVAQTPAATPDTAKHPSDLPPMATPITPDRLAQFLPKMDGYLRGELVRETKIRKNFNSSMVEQPYTKGDKKFTVQINDYAYVPFLYQPFEQFQGNYLDDNNDERTETTTIGGFRAVQTWEKKNHRSTIFSFPGKRYVVRLIGDNLTNVDEARAVLESMDLSGLSQLQ